MLQGRSQPRQPRAMHLRYARLADSQPRADFLHREFFCVVEVNDELLALCQFADACGEMLFHLALCQKVERIVVDSTGRGFYQVNRFSTIEGRAALWPGYAKAVKLPKSLL